MSFEKLKKNRNKSFEKLNEQIDKLATKGYKNPDDDKYWKPKRDQAGNGYAVIRFLPPPEGEDMPFVQKWSHGFKGPGGWYIEDSLTTIGQDDPVSEYNTKLWNTGIEDNKQIARKQKRNLKFISNIYVIKDSQNPDNEGKVFLYAYGKKIFDKLSEMMHPSFEDEEPMNPFDFWEGANFKLKIKTVQDFPNYDKSEFDSAGPLFDDDDKLKEIYESQFSLQEIIDPSKFKSYDELNARLHKVLQLDGDQEEEKEPRPASSKKAKEDKGIDMSSLDEDDEPEKPSKSETKKKEVVEDDDDDLEFFKNLTADDED